MLVFIVNFSNVSDVFLLHRFRCLYSHVAYSNVANHFSIYVYKENTVVKLKLATFLRIRASKIERTEVASYMYIIFDKIVCEKSQ